MHNYIGSALFLIITNCLSVFSIDTLKILENIEDKLTIYPSVYSYEDTSNNLTINDIFSLQDSFEKTDNNKSLNFGLNKNNCWLKFTIKNTSNEKISYLLIVSNPDLNYLDFYEFIGSKLINKRFTGELKEKNSRTIPHRFFLYEIKIMPDSAHTYFIRSNNGGDSNIVPISIQKKYDFYKSDSKDNFLFGIIYGILLFIIGFNFYLYRIGKDKVYLYYLLYIFLVTVFLLSTDGFLYYLGWQWLSNMGRILIPSVAVFYFVSFSQKFLESSIKWPKLHLVLNIIKIIILIIGLLPIFHFTLFIPVYVVGIICLFSVSFIIFIIYAFRSYNKEYLPSQYFLFSFIVMAVFTVIYGLKELGVLSYNFFTTNSVRYGFTFESVLLTIAVLERFHMEQENIKKAIEESRSKIKLQNKELEIINTELEKLSIVASETDNSVAIYDQNGRIEWCNEGFEKFYETNISKLIEQKKDTIEDIIPYSKVKDLFKKCISNKAAVIFEAQLKFSDKNDKWMRTTLSPYTKGNKVIAVDTDITSLKEYETELKQAKEKAEESDRIKTIFLSNMSHEVRTPLNGILGFSELLIHKEISSDDREKYVEIIKSNGEQLIRIIYDILDMSLIETNQLKIWNSDFSLTKFCEELVEFFQFYKSSIGKSEIKLIKELNIDTELDLIFSDNSRLKQVLMNVLKNGFKFTDEGHVKLGCSTNTNNILFFVEDTGIGIEPSKIDDVFERFRQADEKSTRKYGGNGLGLSISKGIIEKMGGNIWIDPEYTIGFRICFVIPLKQSEKVINENEKSRIGEQHISTIKDKRILIVEDHDISYQYLESLLQPFSGSLLRAKNGHEAVQKIKGNHFDLVLMDINLPELNGIEATKEVRKFNKNIPIIAQTVYAMPTEESSILESGCNDVISKPINSKKLFEKIEANL